VVDPDSDVIHVFHDGEFVPYRMRSDAIPRVASSADWFRGWRENLGLAVIEEPCGIAPDIGPPQQNSAETTAAE
jgi:hypothetical protein